MTDANRHPVAPWSTRVREAKRRGAERAAADVERIHDARSRSTAALRRRLDDAFRAAVDRQDAKERRRGRRARAGAGLSGVALALSLFAATAPEEGAVLSSGPVTTVAHDATYAAVIQGHAAEIAATLPVAASSTPPVDAPVETPAPTATVTPRWTPAPRERTPPPPATTASCDEGTGDPCCAFGRIMC